MELYGWANKKVKPLSPRELRQLRKNMAKVPELQRKSNQHHDKEAAEAEKLLDQLINEPLNELESIDTT